MEELLFADLSPAQTKAEIRSKEAKSTSKREPPGIDTSLDDESETSIVG